MSRSLVTVRKIFDTEACVVERALTVAATDPSSIDLIAQVPLLQVIGQCGCGCSSIDFLVPAPGQTARIVADAIGKAQDGEDLGLIVWALDGQLSGLEVYSYSDRPAPLPIVASICGYDGKGSADAA
jgi:hypothetical protein